MTVNSTRDFIPPEPFEGQNYKPRYARPSLRAKILSHVMNPTACSVSLGFRSRIRRIPCKKYIARTDTFERSILITEHLIYTYTLSAFFEFKFKDTTVIQFYLIMEPRWLRNVICFYQLISIINCIKKCSLIYLFVCLFISLFVYLFIYLFVYLFVYLFICLCVYLFICLYIYLFICSFIYIYLQFQHFRSIICKSLAT